MHKSLTLDTVDVVVARGLQATALQALERGEPVDFYLHPAGPEVKGCILVETLVVGDRAGQVTNGAAVWGDWDGATHTIRLDERGPEGEALVAGLDGQHRPAFQPDMVAQVYDVPSTHVEIPDGLRLDFLDIHTSTGMATVPIDPPMPVSSFSDVELMVQSLASLKGYPATRTDVRALDAEWERRGPERFAAAKEEVAAWRADEAPSR